ncbi:MAG TPA: sugar transferase [Gaiellaceae bacterium]|jgi:exopolysaccharide biosynthesis polyprenyl glycosylphosphotransferase
MSTAGSETAAAVDSVGVALEQPAARARRISRRTAWTTSLVLVDGAMLAAAAVSAQAGAPDAADVSATGGWMLAFAALALALYWARGLYRLPVRVRVLDTLRSVVIATSLAGMAILSLRLLLTWDPLIAVQTFRPWAFAAVYAAAGRGALYWTQAGRGGAALRPTLIVGAGAVGRTVGRRLQQHPELGLRPVGFLDRDPLPMPPGESPPVLGASCDLDDVVERHGIEQLIVTFTTERDEALLGVVERAEHLGVQVAIVPRLFEKVPERLSVDHLGGLPLLTPHPADPRSVQFTIKYALDRVVALVCLALAAPVMLAAAVTIRASMGRPVLFRQVRVGRDGRRFELLKFRSMEEPTPGEPDGVETIAPDSAPGGVEGVDRRTRVGAFLRMTSIDELPQLVNVLRGEMSVVGPRPERPEFVSRFEQTVYRYGDRHRVKAGITGWAQVHGLRGQTSIADRAEWDNFYVENWSLWLDVKILLRTVGAVLGLLGRVQ